MPLFARLAAALALVTIVAAPAAAHKGATGVVMHRMNMMKDLQKAMRDMAAMVKGQRRFDPARFAAHAATIQRHAEQMPKMFPRHSNKPPSEALPSIWTDWQGFMVRVKAMAEAAFALDAAAKTGERRAILKSFGGVARSCTGCHTSFRQRK